MTGVPHVARMAGSDAGRLWHHPQLELLYDHVLCSAEAVVAVGAVAERAIQRGVSPDRIMRSGGFMVPDDLFAPEGPKLDIAVLQAEATADPEFRDLIWGNFAADRPYFGVYGKLGEQKGSFALLAAMHRLMSAGLDVGLIALAHGGATVERDFRTRATELGLADRVLQIPFLPHWRVPEFLRGCLAVCCLEQDFPIGFHSPITPLEVLLCGACLVGSTEVIRKLPNPEHLADGYNCVAIEDVNNVAKLSERLAAIVTEPGPIPFIGTRGRKFAREAQEKIDFPQKLESVLTKVARRQPPTPTTSGSAAGRRAQSGRFPLTQMAAEALAGIHGQRVAGTAVAEINLERAQNLLAEINRAIDDGKIAQLSLAQALEAEIAIAAAEADDLDADDGVGCDPLFRLRSGRWAVGDLDLSTLAPVHEPRLRMLRFDYDVSKFRSANTIADLPPAAAFHPSYVVVFRKNANRTPLIVDAMTARFLELVDGRKTVAEILRQLDRGASIWTSASQVQWIENLFRWGLIGLRHIDFR
jgi:hypothetical protein